MKITIAVIMFALFLLPGSVFAEEKIDINAASKEELQKIIGVGPIIAQRIIDARPFSSVHDLIRVNGIGEITLQKITKQDLAGASVQEKPEIKTRTESESEPAPAAEIEPEAITPAENPASEKELAAVGEPLQGGQNKQTPKTFLLFLIASAIAIFSGIIILTLKKKLKIS